MRGKLKRVNGWMDGCEGINRCRIVDGHRLDEEDDDDDDDDMDR
jgi:hypothetical protein